MIKCWKCKRKKELRKQLKENVESNKSLIEWVMHLRKIAMKKKDLSYKYYMTRYKKTEKQKNKKYFKKKLNFKKT
jgi:hypothetical protein